MIKIDSLETGTPATLVVELAHVAGALRSNGNERSARVVEAAKERIEGLSIRDDALRAIIDYDEEYNHLSFADLIRALIAKAIKYRSDRDQAVEALEFIRDEGGKCTEDGLACTGSWCAEQARAFLNTANKGGVCSAPAAGDDTHHKLVGGTIQEDKR